MSSFTSTSAGGHIDTAIEKIDKAIGIIDKATVRQGLVVAVATSPIKINVLLSFKNTNGGDNDKCRIVNEKPTQLSTTRNNENWVFLELKYDRTNLEISTKSFGIKPTIETPSQNVTNVTIKDTDIDTIKQCVESAIDPNNKFFTIKDNFLKIKPVYVEKNGEVFKIVDSATVNSKTLEITPDIQIGIPRFVLLITPTKLKLSFDDEVKFADTKNINFLDGSSSFDCNKNTVTNLNTALEKKEIITDVLSTKGGAKSKTKKGGRGRRRYKTQRR